MNKIIAFVLAGILIVAGIALYLIYPTGEQGDKVLYVTIKPPDMKTNLAEGEVDGYIAWEPFCSDSILGGAGHALIWSGDIRQDHPCCVVLVSDQFLASENGPELTKRLLKAHIDATEWINEALEDPGGDNHTALIEMGVEFTGRNASVVTASFEHLKYDYAMTQDFIDTIAWYTESFINISVIPEGALESKGYDNAEDFANTYVKGTYLNEAQSVSENETILGTVRLGYLIGDIHQIAQFVAKNETVFGNKSLFEKYGVNVIDAEGAPYSNGPSEMDSFASGYVDIGYLGGPPAILKHINNPGVQAKIVAQANSEGSAIVVSDEILTIDDLKGKTIGIPGEGTIQYLLLQVYLRDNGLELRAA